MPDETDFDPDRHLGADSDPDSDPGPDSDPDSDPGPDSGPGENSPARLVVDVADLRRRLGQRRHEAIDIRLARQMVVGSRTTDRPVVGEVVVESIERGVSVFGRVRFTWEGDCRRCLDVTGGELDVDIAEIFQVEAPEDTELIDLEGDRIDLVPIVRDAVVLSLPLAPLCGDDCAGPDPDRYPARTQADLEAEAAAAEPVPDPRWAALDQLKPGSN